MPLCECVLVGSEAQTTSQNGRQSQTDSFETDSRHCECVMLDPEAIPLARTIGKPRLIHSRLIHTTRLIVKIEF